MACAEEATNHYLKQWWHNPIKNMRHQTTTCETRVGNKISDSINVFIFNNQACDRIYQLAMDNAWLCFNVYSHVYIWLC